MTGLMVPEHRDERVANPRDPANAQPGPEGIAALATRRVCTNGQAYQRGEAAGTLKSPPTGADRAQSLPHQGALPAWQLTRHAEIQLELPKP